eukprot:1981121-Pleurochrysis_carterae.AAC.1
MPRLVRQLNLSATPFDALRLKLSQGKRRGHLDSYSASGTTFLDSVNTNGAKKEKVGLLSHALTAKPPTFPCSEHCKGECELGISNLMHARAACTCHYGCRRHPASARVSATTQEYRNTDIPQQISAHVYCKTR